MPLFRSEVARERRFDFSGSPTYNPFENPSVPLQSVAFDSVYGLISGAGNAAGRTVTIDTGLAIPTVWRCVSLLATVVASCPLEVFRGPDKEPVKIKCLDPENSATTHSQFELWELVTAHIALWGNAYVLKLRNEAGQIIDLRPIVPSRVKVKRVKRDTTFPDGKCYLVERKNEDGSDAKPIPLNSDQVMHIPGFGYDGLRGLSPLQVASQTFGTALAADELAARFFSNGQQLSGIIQVKAPLQNEGQALDIKRRWMEIHSGVGNAGTVAVLDAETDFKPLTIPPDSLQFLESRQWEVSEVARMFGVPPFLIGDETKATSWGSGIEAINTGFVTYTIASYTERIQQRSTREVVATRGQRAVFDLGALMRGSTLERYQAYAVGIQSGWLLRNEARKDEDLEPVEGLSEPLTPVNMAAGNSPIPAAPYGQQPQKTQPA
jgi:HK97 family phage portal protein